MSLLYPLLNILKHLSGWILSTAIRWMMDDCPLVLQPGDRMSPYPIAKAFWNWLICRVALSEKAAKHSKYTFKTWFATYSKLWNWSYIGCEYYINLWSWSALKSPCRFFNALSPLIRSAGKKQSGLAPTGKRGPRLEPRVFLSWSSRENDVQMTSKFDYSHDGSMVLVYIYMLTWLGYIDGKCYHI